MLIQNIDNIRSGIRNCDTYSQADFDALAIAFGEINFKPTIKFGHREKDCLPRWRRYIWEFD